MEDLYTIQPSTNKQKYKRLNELGKQFSEALATNYTASEGVFKSMLDSAGLKYEFQKPFNSASNLYIADFVFPEFNIIVEVDGASHNDKQQYDHNRDKWFGSRGYKTIRLKNSVAEKITKEQLLERFTNIILKRHSKK